MSKILSGTVVSNKMNKTIVVEVTRKVPHPLYRKLIARSKKFLVDNGNKSYAIGETVKIIETKPLAKNKHFQVVETKEGAKK